MILTGSQHQQIQEALLSAFDEAGLRQLVRQELDADLDAVAGGKNRTENVQNLIAWAERKGRVADLIEGAVRQNPGNPDLQGLAEDAKDWHIEEPEPGEPPYQGLAYFDVADADRFFGREALTAELVAYLKEHRFLAVVGASGSGKSSVVRAGVVAALTNGTIQGSDTWATYIVTPTARPLETLAIALVLPSEAEDGIARFKKAQQEDTDSLHLRARRLLSAIDKSHVLLVVDQFEELFTLCKDKDERRAFVDNLLNAAASDGATTVVLTLRADFYAHCAEYDNLRAALETDQRYIGAMTRDELRTAIENPAKRDAWDLEPELTDLMLDDVANERGALPLLSFALLQTWERRSGRTMTLVGYREAGGVRGAIANTADTVYGEMTEQEQAVARSIFLRLTELGDGVQDTRRRVPVEELALLPDVANVVQRLEDARLVTAERMGETATYLDVAHEALIREWPRLREWLDEDREGLLIHRKLTEASLEWEKLGRDPGALYRGVQLQQVQDWVAAHAGELNALEQAFLAASRAQAARARNAKRLVWVAAGVVILILIGAVIAFSFQNQELEVQTRNAVNAEATAQANFELAQQQLLLLEGERLLQEARQLKEALDPEGAIAKFDEAAAADPSLKIDLSAEMSDTLRYVATTWVQEGEAILREATDSGVDAIRQQAVVSATALFSQALALDPPADTPVYVWIPAGEFLMGSSDEDSLAVDDEKPQHSVWLNGYWIQRTEVTNEQFKRCVDAGPCEPPRNWYWDKPRSAKLPVAHMDWYRANAYAAWVGGRLPTEAEWEKACRGTEGNIYPWGNEPPSAERLNYDVYVGTNIEVGTYPSGANGLYDMAGNASEWTSTQYAEYPNDRNDGREAPEGGGFRTMRGGSPYTFDDAVRCASRVSNSPYSWSQHYGFRVVAQNFWDDGS